MCAILVRTPMCPGIRIVLLFLSPRNVFCYCKARKRLKTSGDKVEHYALIIDDFWYWKLSYVSAVKRYRLQDRKSTRSSRHCLILRLRNGFHALNVVRVCDVQTHRDKFHPKFTPIFATQEMSTLLPIVDIISKFSPQLIVTLQEHVLPSFIFPI